MNLVVVAYMMDSTKGSVNMGRWIKRLLHHTQVEVLGGLKSSPAMWKRRGDRPLKSSTKKSTFWALEASRI